MLDPGGGSEPIHGNSFTITKRCESMSKANILDQTTKLEVENMGGIDKTTVDFSPGITVLAGRNATNRTSLLRSIMAVMGSDNASLKADADEGRVELSVGEETYVRTFTRTNGSVMTGGNPYLDEPELADLFAFLLETNEARRSVARGADLRELIMRPVDTESIQSEIQQLEQERSQIDDELDELNELKGELPKLEDNRSQLKDEIEEKKKRNWQQRKRRLKPSMPTSTKHGRRNRNSSPGLTNFARNAPN